MRMLTLVAAMLAMSIHLASAADQPPSEPPATAPAAPKFEKVEIAGELFKLELAIDEPARQKGLMGRTELKRNAGMLFVFPNSNLRSFWMANCVIDIDVMFLDEEGRITALHRMKTERPQRRWESEVEYEARLKRYSSRKAAQFAIELQTGSIDRLELKVGQVIDLDRDRLKKLAR